MSVKCYASISIECDSTAEKLAEVLAVQFDGVIEITGISQNVIQGTYIQK